jgi:hypothetical protein
MKSLFATIAGLVVGAFAATGFTTGAEWRAGPASVKITELAKKVGRL